ncbi:MAG: glycoside hydrolase family protein [Planctomycetota bacterium]|jgi:predicted GH43/DUF377 family glycosyl hydrolase
MKKLIAILVVIATAIALLFFSTCEEFIQPPSPSHFQASGVYEKYTGNPIANLADKIPGMKGGFSDPSVLYADGKYHMWFPCNNGKVSQICYGTSDNGIQWETHPEPVLKLGKPGSWDDYNCDTPTVIKDGPIYKMWYSGYSRVQPSIYKNIGYATSHDGIHWTRLPAKKSPYGKESVVFTMDETKQGEIYSIADPVVVKVNGTYHMWYNGFGTKPFSMLAISHATSSDGINWQRDPLNPVLIPSKPWEMVKEKEGAVNQPTVLWNGKNFEMWYGSFKDKYMRYSAISHAVSKDGSKWIKDSAPALVPGPEDLWPSVTAIRIGNKTHLYYIGFPRLGDPARLYIAISTQDSKSR